MKLIFTRNASFRQQFQMMTTKHQRYETRRDFDRMRPKTAQVAHQLDDVNLADAWKNLRTDHQTHQDAASALKNCIAFWNFGAEQESN